MNEASARHALALPNIRRFIAFRVFFNARFYYPVFTVLFLDFGLTIEQFALLNVIWAISIVCLEVPSGALADTIGRRPLVIAAAAIMVVEIALICFAPIGGSPWLFPLFALNRLLSGAAEASASGADEALAYDSLAARGLEGHWGDVLERQMRLQSLAFVGAMVLGALAYDHERINAFLGFLGSGLRVEKELAMRLPLFGTLVLALFAFASAVGFEEPTRPARAAASFGKVARESFFRTLRSGGWILRTPLAFMILLAGLLFDHVVRMILTLNSEFYRVIGLPEASYGLIGAALATLGVFMPRLGRELATRRSKAANFFILAGGALLGIWLMARFAPYWSALPMAFVYATIFLNGYLVSRYLNEIADSDQRATVLSFKGLTFNLAYGAIGLAYAQLVANLRSGSDVEPAREALFAEAFSWFPPYFLAAACLVALTGAILLRGQRRGASA